MSRNRTTRIDDGFTLIEMMVVVVILSVLAAIAIPVLLGNVRHAGDAKARSDLRNVALYEEGYAADNSATYASAAELAGIGDRLPVSQQDTVWVYTADAKGYCLVGHSESSQAYVVYESGTGLQQATQATLGAAQQSCTDAGYSPAGTLVNDGTGTRAG